MITNDLAIIMASKIENALVHEFFINKTNPSFYEIRKTILNVLDNYIGVMHSKYRTDLSVLSHLPKKDLERYAQAQQQSQVYEMIDLIFNDPDFTDKWERVDDYSVFREINTSIGIIKSGKINRDVKKVQV